VTHLRQIMLEELERRNYAPGTIRTYIRTVEHFAQHFHCSPDKLGLRLHCLTGPREYSLLGIPKATDIAAIYLSRR
jgi:hypothetical protein